MTNNGIITIHGKDYMTVARRVELAHENSALESVETEVLSHDPVVIKARVVINGKAFTGISAVNLESSRMIERENPYEVAETSAVGRALGFAGYGLLESIASADEMVRAVSSKAGDSVNKTTADTSYTTTEKVTCDICGKAAFRRRGKSRGGREYKGIFCSTGDKTHTRWIWNSDTPSNSKPKQALNLKD